jgi:hypothetical protein
LPQPTQHRRSVGLAGVVQGEDGDDLRHGLGRFGTRFGYRIRLGDDEDVLRWRTLTGAIAAHLLRGAAAAPGS